MLNGAGHLSDAALEAFLSGLEAMPDEGHTSLGNLVAVAAANYAAEGDVDMDGTLAPSETGHKRKRAKDKASKKAKSVKKAHIDKEDAGSIIEALLKKGFYEAQINKIQKIKHSESIFAAIDKNYVFLNNTLGLNPSQITEIAEHDSAVRFIECLIEHQEAPTHKPANFTSAEIVKIIAHNGGDKNMEALLANYETLRGAEFAFTKDDLIKIVGVKGGHLNLEAVLKHFKALSDPKIGCSKAQILKLAAKTGGSKAIEALLEEHEALKALEYNNEQIIRMASYEGGRKTIATVLKKHSELQALGFDHEQISVMAGRMGATSCIETILTRYEELKNFGLTRENILTLTDSEGSGATIVETLCKYKDVIKVAELKLELVLGLMKNFRKNKKFVDYLNVIEAYATSHSKEQVITYAREELSKTFSKTILSRLTGVPVIEGSSAAALKPRTANEVTIPNLIKKGFSQEALNKIAKLTGNELTLTALNDSYEALKSLGLTHEQMLQLATHEGGSNNINGFINHYATLTTKGFSLDQIVNMAGHGGGEKTLKEVIANYSHLTTELKFTAEDIAVMAKSAGAANAIKAVVSSHAELSKCGFENSQIAKIASYAGSSVTLPALFKNFAILESLGFNIEQMVKLASGISASQSMDMVIAEQERIKRLDPSIDQMIVRINTRRKGALHEFLDSCDGLKAKLALVSESSSSKPSAATSSLLTAIMGASAVSAPLPSEGSTMPFRKNFSAVPAIPLKSFKPNGGAGVPSEVVARRY